MIAAARPQHKSLFHFLGSKNTPNINLTRHGTGSAVLLNLFSVAISCCCDLFAFWGSWWRLAASWWRLGASCGLLAYLGGVLEAAWARLGESWARLGGVLGASWGVLGASWETKKHYFSPLFFQCFCVPKPRWYNLASASVLKRLGRVLGTSWERLGRVLGVLGSVLGASWGVLGAAWGHLGAPWGRLGASWARLWPLKTWCEIT